MNQKRVIVFGLLGLTSSLTFSQPLEITVRTGAGYESNSTFLQNNKRSNTSFFGGIGILGQYESTKSKLDAALDFERILNNNQEDRSSIQGSINAVYIFSPNFQWVANNIAFETYINPLESSNSNNIAQGNIFSTGPVLTIQPTSVDVINLNYLYQIESQDDRRSNISVSESDTKQNDFETARIQWMRTQSDSFSYGLNTSYSKSEIDLDNSFESVFIESYVVALQSNWKLKKQSYSINLGYQESDDVDQSAVVGDIQSQWLLTPKSNLMFQYARSLSATSEQVFSGFFTPAGFLEVRCANGSSDCTSNLVNNPETELDTNYALSNSAALNWNYEISPVHLLGINYKYSRLKEQQITPNILQDDLLLNQSESASGLTYKYVVSDVFSLGSGLYHTRRSLSLAESELEGYYKETGVTLTFDYQLSKALSTRLGFFASQAKKIDLDAQNLLVSDEIDAENYGGALSFSYVLGR